MLTWGERLKMEEVIVLVILISCNPALIQHKLLHTDCAVLQESLNFTVPFCDLVRDLHLSCFLFFSQPFLQLFLAGNSNLDFTAKNPVYHTINNTHFHCKPQKQK